MREKLMGMTTPSRIAPELPARVFISYTGEVRPAVEHLARLPADEGLDVRTDQGAQGRIDWTSWI